MRDFLMDGFTDTDRGSDRRIRNLERESRQDPSLKPQLKRTRERAGQQVFIGIDPGQQGYVACIPHHGYEVLWAHPIPTLPTGKGAQRDYDLPAVWALVQTFPTGAFIMLERQQAYPKQGSVSNFNIGRGYMLWEAMLTAAGLSYDTVHPRTWKGKMGLRADRAAKKQSERQKQAKAKAVKLAQRLFPGYDLRDRRKPKARVPCPDHAEAILLAVFGRRDTDAVA